jgi:hypothetical protein
LNDALVDSGGDFVSLNHFAIMCPALSFQNRNGRWLHSFSRSEAVLNFMVITDALPRSGHVTAVAVCQSQQLMSVT